MWANSVFIVIHTFVLTPLPPALFDLRLQMTMLQGMGTHRRRRGNQTDGIWNPGQPTIKHTTRTEHGRSSCTPPCRSRSWNAVHQGCLPWKAFRQSPMGGKLKTRIYL
jgi:hypothetical protein